MTTEEKLQVIRQHFKDKGMKQADVAKALGVSRATVCNLMNGAPFGRRTAYSWSAGTEKVLDVCPSICHP